MFLWICDDPCFRYCIGNEISWKERTEHSMKSRNDIYLEVME
jgi:hypothetical protein